jgi:hypothetical protein
MGLRQYNYAKNDVFMQGVLTFKAKHQSSHPPAALPLPGQSVSA